MSEPQTALAEIEIDGVIYAIEKESTPEQEDKEGRHHLAAHMREYKQLAYLYLRRPKGKVVYYAVRGARGVSPVTRLGVW